MNSNSICPQEHETSNGGLLNGLVSSVVFFELNGLVSSVVFFEMEVVETHFFIGQIRYSSLIITEAHSGNIPGTCSLTMLFVS
jgi:hypothetical protein